MRVRSSVHYMASDPIANDYTDRKYQSNVDPLVDDILSGLLAFLLGFSQGSLLFILA